MTRRLFVCHATADIEATSALVDALENALNFTAGSIWTSGLPGYSADTNDMPALGAALAGSDVVLALVTQTSVRDAQFYFQLGAGWALGAHTVLFVLDPALEHELPSALDQTTLMRGHVPSQWSVLIGDLSVRLGLVPRPGASNAPAIRPSSPPPAFRSATPPTAAPAATQQVEALHPAAASLADASLAEHATLASSAHAAPAPALDAAPASPADAPAAAATPAEAARVAGAAHAAAHAALAEAASRAAAAFAALAAPPAAAKPAAHAPPEAAAHAAAEAYATPAADSSEPPRTREDDTPLPAALAAIANATAAPARSPNPRAQQPITAVASKTISVPPLPGATSAHPVSGPALPTRSVGVPPLPAAVSSAVIVPPPLASDAISSEDEEAEVGEPTTTPKAPIIVISALPAPEAPSDEPEQEPKPEPRPQPRAAGSYPSVAPQHSYLDELRAINGDQADERRPTRYSYIDELQIIDPEEYAAAAGGYGALEADDDDDDDDDDEPETREQLRVPAREDGAPDAVLSASDSDVFARLPTCEMALEAGRAVSDCLFNRDEIDDFGLELDGPLGSLIECLGASWVELRGEQDLDTWIAVTDHLLETLPEEVIKLEEWYRVGFELATLHNLAGQLVLDGSDPAAEQHWRSALERFLMRAERAEIGYENLGRVLGLLENLVGPSHERDLSNIPRSLEELRRYAAGADIHTAA